MVNLTPTTREAVSTLKQDVDKVFGSRVISLILFGSVLREETSNDIDVELLLDLPKNNDLLLLHNIVSKSPIKIDLLLTYKTELTTYKEFRKKAQGSYFLYSLANGLLLLGKSNYYKKLLACTDKKQILHDLHIKNREYQHALRSFLLEEDVVSKQKNLAKYLLRYIYQTLLLLNRLTYYEILTLKQREIIEILKQRKVIKKSEIEFLIKLLYGEEKNKDRLISSSAAILYKFEEHNNKYSSLYGN